MLEDKLTLQMQLNCIITQIDFVLTFEMYRYLVASLSRKGSESKSLSISLEKKQKHVKKTEEKIQLFLTEMPDGLEVFNIQVAFNIDINCPHTLNICHKILLHIKQNLYAEKRVGFVCLLVLFWH